MTLILGAGQGGMQPTTPTIGTATAGNANASVTFTPSTYIGKGTITYTVTSSPGNFTGTGSASPITVSGLTNGTAYTFTVRGTTNYGVSSASSAASNSVTPVQPAAFDSIATLSGTGSSGTITFSSIPQTYRHLHLRVWYRESSGGSNYSDINMRFNGSTASYSRNSASYNGSSISNNTSKNTTSGLGFFYGTGSGYSANHYGGGYFDILDYSVAGVYKVARGFSGIPAAQSTYDGGFGYSSYVWEGSGNAITQLEIISANGVNFDTNSRFYLYGIKEI